MMALIPILLSSLALLFWLFSSLGYGLFFIRLINPLNKSLLDSVNGFFIVGVLGIFLIGQLAVVVNFFSNINDLVRVIILLPGLGFAFINRFYLIQFFNPAYTGFLFLYSILHICQPFQHADTGLYYLQAIKWIHESAAPFGVGLLEYRLGVPSSWFYDEAVMAGWPLRLVMNKSFANILLNFYWGYTILKSLNYIFKGILTVQTVYWAASGLFWLVVLSYSVSSPSPDYAVYSISILLASIFINLLVEDFKIQDVCICILFSIALLTIKLSSIIIVFFGLLISFYCVIKKKLIFNKSLWLTINISIGVLLFWVTSSILLSGYIVYPVKELHTSVPWIIPDLMVDQHTNQLLGWARSPSPKYLDSLTGTDWIVPWIRRNIAAINFWLFFMVITLVLFIIRFQIESKFNFDWKWFLLFSMPIMGIIFLLVRAPDFRYGSVYFSIPLLYACSYFITTYYIDFTLNFNKHFNSKFVQLIILIVLCYLILIYGYFGIASLGNILVLICLFLFWRNVKILLLVFTIIVLFMTVLPPPFSKTTNYSTSRLRDGTILTTPMDNALMWDSPLPSSMHALEYVPYRNNHGEFSGFTLRKY